MGSPHNVTSSSVSVDPALALPPRVTRLAPLHAEEWLGCSPSTRCARSALPPPAAKDFMVLGRRGRSDTGLSGSEGALGLQTERGKHDQQTVRLELQELDRAWRINPWLENSWKSTTASHLASSASP